MFFQNKFTEKAAKAIAFAQETAAEMGHGYVGSEHVLMGLLKEESGVANQILTDLGVTAENVEGQIRDMVGTGSPSETAPQGLTPRTKRVVELAFRSAAALGQSYVGTEHLLMGLVREGENVALHILNNLGVTPNKIAEALTAHFGGGEEAPAASGAAPAKGRGGKKGMLEKFGKDLTKAAKNGELDPVIGRDEEIDRVIQILSRRTKNNPALVGEPGVGKTAVAEGLALKMVSGNVPENLKNKRLIALDIPGMVAGTKYRGEFEERIKSVIDELIAAKDTIVFIDELHMIVGAGASEGAVDAANILKPALARGELQIIGATTLDEYRKHIEKDSALERRFQPVEIGEPSPENAVLILKGLRDRYEAHHRIKITDDAIDAAVKLSVRYIGGRRLPDKAIDLMDEAASRVRMKRTTAPPELKDLEKELETIQAEKEEAIAHEEFEKAASIRDRENTLKSQMEEKKKQWQEGLSQAHDAVTAEDIAEVVAGWTGIPASQLTEDESKRLLNMEEILHRRVIGQDEAVTAVSKAIRRGRVGLRDPKRPIGSFIFLGPTGVGKTELCKALGEVLFGDENSLIRVDMSEYMEKHSVSKLIGSPPGYVGYDEGGQLTEKVRHKPYAVILFDEIEKAHPDVFNIMLQILDDGVLTDAQGRRVDFKNTVIIMTSNIGARKITGSSRKSLGFGAEEKDAGEVSFADIKKEVMADLKEAFRPEFLNRVDDIIVFNRLTQPQIEQIAEKLLGAVKERMGEMELDFNWEESAVKHLAKAGFDPVYGARPLKRAVQSQVEDLVAEKFLQGSIQKGDKVLLKATEEKLDIEKIS